METFIIKAAQLVLALAILIVIHEFGHFLFARVFGVKVEKFYIFFDPWTELFKWRPRRHVGGMGRTFYLNDEAEAEGKEREEYVKAEADVTEAREKQKKGESAPELPAAEATMTEQERRRLQRDCEEYEKEKKESRWKRFWGHTEYGVGWVPLGGYCKISGMIDESMDTKQMERPAQPWEFRSKPAWQRLLIMTGGVLFNFLTAIIIYAGIVYATGEKYVPVNKAGMGMAFSGEAQKAGFRDGDIPLTADGTPLVNPADARMQMVQAKSVMVLRDGDTVTVPVPEDLIFRLDGEMKSDTAMINFMAYRMPTRIIQVSAGMGADKGGVKVGDEVVAIDSVPTPTLDVFFKTLEGHDDKTVALTVTRETPGKAGRDTLTLQVPLSSNSKMGVGLETDLSQFFPAVTKRYNLFESVPRGISMGTDKLVAYAKSMKLVFTKEGASNIGGFGTIGSIFPDKWNWIAFWNIAAFLAVALAFMNILPIPALDGGHVLFLIYEMITGRPAPQKFMEAAQMVGMGLLLLLLLYANGMDIVRLFMK